MAFPEPFSLCGSHRRQQRCRAITGIFISLGFLLLIIYNMLQKNPKPAFAVSVSHAGVHIGVDGSLFPLLAPAAPG